VGYNGQAQQTDAQQIESSFTDPEAFTVLFERHAVPLYRYIVTRVGRGDAHDILGETFATAFRSRRAYDLDRSDARAWLFGIATNCARHLWRSEQRRLTREAAAASVRDIEEDQSEEAISTVFFHDQSQPIAEALEQTRPRLPGHPPFGGRAWLHVRGDLLCPRNPGGHGAISPIPRSTTAPGTTWRVRAIPR